MRTSNSCLVSNNNLILYKYFSNGDYAQALLNDGVLRFSALSYYRDYEDTVRGDQFEGTLVYAPSTGLTVTKVRTGETLSLPMSFESAAHESNIYIYCMSEALTQKIADEFGATHCVEIKDRGRLLAEVRSALRRRPKIKNKSLIYGAVRYYDEQNNTPQHLWALPEMIAMSKRIEYAHQHEYRLAFDSKDAFKVENVRTRLVSHGDRRPQRYFRDDHMMMRVGSLRDYAKLHKLR